VGISKTKSGIQEWICTRCMYAGLFVCKYGVGTGMGLSMWWYRVSMGVRVLMREGQGRLGEG
jgi:hypothetical protein